jgi:hypothetical protein
VKRSLVEGDYLQHLDVDGEEIFIGSLSNRKGGVDWIDLAQDKVRSLTLLKAVMKFWGL